MPLLFSYGTLQQENVQLSTFGRLLAGQADALVEFEQAMVRIEDPEVVATSGKALHPIVRFNGNPASRVAGTVFEITDAELDSADKYEVDDYKRVFAKLASGKHAWVYVAARMSSTEALADLPAFERELHSHSARANPARLAELLHPQFVEFGRSGRVYGFKETIALLAQEAHHAHVHSQDFAVRLLAEGVTLLTYKSAHRGNGGDLERYSLRSSIWQLGTRGWQLVFHQGTPTEPFIEKTTSGITPE